jgi:NAD(P)-dependent dehydrogenase (short-subunit alcohol dehydrogenase family)
MKHIVITGGTRGIGFGLAERFLERGHRVTLNGSDQFRIDEALLLLSAYKERVYGVEGDVADREAMKHLFCSAFNRFGNVDIWVNNAGIGQPQKRVWELDDTAVKRLIAVNLIGVINGTVAAFNGMRPQGSGKIFNMEGHGSKGSIIDGMSIYGTTKSAMHYFTRAFAHEAKGCNVQFGELSPGMVITGLLMDTVKEPSEESRKMKGFYNLLADDVESVSEFLVNRMLASTSQYERIEWLTKRKAMFRLLFGFLRRRDFFAS